MGISKTENFSTSQNNLATMFKALAHPARVAIIEYLLEVNSCICGDIVEKLPLAQPTISQHLKELKNAGIIKGSIEGNSICYCLNEQTFDTLKQYFDQLNIYFKNKNTPCCK